MNHIESPKIPMEPTISESHLQEIVKANRYELPADGRFISRCIDGRYANEPGLPALALPGADAGELALVFATANYGGFDSHPDKVYKSLVEVVGGEQNLRFHTDDHADPDVIMAGCGHIKQMGLDPVDYSLQSEQVDFIKDVLKDALKKGAQQVKVEGPHLEGAAVIVKGNFGIFPQYAMEAGHGRKVEQIFIHHKTLIDVRHRALVKSLIKNNAIELTEGCDEEYLYEILSEVTDSHLLETAKRLAPKKPLYVVEFDEFGNFQTESQGQIPG